MSQPWDIEFQKHSKLRESLFRRVVNNAKLIPSAVAMVGLVYVAVIIHTVKTARRQYNKNDK